MNSALNRLLHTRKNFIALVKEMSNAELNAIPVGFNNNIIWNFGHTLASQQILCYKLSGLPMHMDNGFIDSYKKGSRPEGNVSEKEVENITEKAEQLVHQLSDELEAGIFKTFSAYTTSYGIPLNNIDEVIEFVNIHEGLHYGYALAIRKAVKAVTV